MPDLTAIFLNCSLKAAPATSSTDRMLGLLADALATHGVTGEHVRVVDLDVKPGVETDQGPGDAWPGLRAKILAADILVLGTPTWMGQPSSVTQRVLERTDAFLSDAGDDGLLPTNGKVACFAVVGNEDGAHHITGVLAQVLSDVGFTIPPSSTAYWNGEAMQATDFVDLDEVPEKVASTVASLAANAAHLAGLLKGSSYPPAQAGDARR